MSKYVRVTMRFCVLFTLVMAASLLSQPAKAMAFSCFTDCNNQWSACRAACNNLPGNESCLADCNEQKIECFAGC